MRAVIASTLALLVVVACGGGPGPAADESKTPAQIEAEVTTAETPVLQKAVEKYKSAIASLEQESKDVESKIKELGGKALDGLLGGEGKTETAGEEVEALKAQMKLLMAQLKDLQSKLTIYVDELASRA